MKLAVVAVMEMRSCMVVLAWRTVVMLKLLLMGMSMGMLVLLLRMHWMVMKA